MAARELALSKRVNDFQTRIKGLTRQMMATVSELSMYQATAMKLQQEKHEREMEAEDAQGDSNMENRLQSMLSTNGTGWSASDCENVRSLSQRSKLAPVLIRMIVIASVSYGQQHNLDQMRTFPMRLEFPNRTVRWHRSNPQEPELQ